MAFTIGTHIQVPGSGTKPHTEIQRSDSSGEVGFAVIAQAAQFLYGRKLPPAVLDWSGIYAGVLKTVESFSYQSRFARMDGLALSYQVWLYVVREYDTTVSDWQIKASNVTASTSVGPTQVNGGTATTGAWWNLGSLNGSASGTYSEWKIECTTASSLGGKSKIRAMAILPDYSRTVLGSGSMTNDVRQLDMANFATSEAFLATYKIADVHKMLIQTWRESVGNVLTRAFYSESPTSAWNLQSGSSYGLIERSWITRPYGATTLQIRALPGATGTMQIFLGRGADMTSGAQALTSSVWAYKNIFPTSLPVSVPLELRIESDVRLDSVNVFWLTPSY